MKIALQITTSTLGDIVIEEADEKTTTNREDQKAIIVELLVQALSKVTAAYKIPKSMLDLGDDDYVDAHTRKQHQDQVPRYSSAAANRASVVTPIPHHASEFKVNCPADCSCIKYSNCQGEEKVEIDPYTTNEAEDEFDLMLSEEEMIVVRDIIHLMRGTNNNE